MIYLFSTLLLINAFLYMSKGSWYFICFVASIVALSITIKVKPRSGLYLFAVAIFASIGVMFSIVHILDYSLRPFIVTIILTLFSVIYIAMCIQENEKIRKTYGSVENHEYLKSHPFEWETKKVAQHEYRINAVEHFNDYFGLIDKYYSAYVQGLLDDPEDGEYPLYVYKKLDCKLEQTDDVKYKVFVNTDHGWSYAGFVDRSSFLDDDIDNMKSWHVEVDGGSTYIASGGKYEKVWLPLHFTLVIELKDTE